MSIQSIIDKNTDNKVGTPKRVPKNDDGGSNSPEFDDLVDALNF